MNCQEIEKILNELKVDSLGRIRNKSKIIDKLHAKYLTDLDSELTNIRVSVALLDNGSMFTAHHALLEVDHIIYKKQIS